MHSQEMLGPVVDIELVDPPDKTPPGVVFGVKHFLTIPSCPEVGEVLEEEGSSHKHYIVKMTKRNRTHEMEVIDSTVSITSQYLVTDKLAERSLCKITSAWLPLPWGESTRHECTHSSLKDLIVTERVGRCPHTKNSLYIWCVCPGSEKEFEKKMKTFSHERTPALMTVDIEKSQQHIYNIKVRLSEREEAAWEPTRQISHVEMCKFNGVKLFDGGTLKGDFGCSCADDKQQCLGDGLVFFEIEDQLPISHDALLLCRNETAVLGVDSVEIKRRTLAESAHGSTNLLVASKTSHKHGWGSKSGTEDDREALRDIISAELKKPENLTTSEFYLFFSNITLDAGLEEDLAEAIDKDFYESYKTWVSDNPTATTSKKVILKENRQFQIAISRSDNG